MENLKKKMISITDENNTLKQVEVVAYFTLPEFDKKYIIYIDGQEEAEDVIYSVATIIETEESFELSKVKTDAEWIKIKAVMRDMVKHEE